MKFVNSLVEVVEQFFLLSLEILELLQPDFVLPLYVLQNGVMVHNCCLRCLQFRRYVIVFPFLFTQFLHLFTSFLERLHYLLVSFFLVHLLLLLRSVFLLGISQFIFQLLNDVQVSVRNFLIVILNVTVLLSMLLGEFLDSLILLVFNL